MSSIHLPPIVAAKLVKVLGLLGSDHDGEIAAAGRRAHAMVREAGLTWGEVIVPPPLKPSLSDREPPLRKRPSTEARGWRMPETPAECARWCLRWPEALTEWEMDFLRSVASRRSFSDKQRNVLHRIVGKIEDFVRVNGECKAW